MERLKKVVPILETVLVLGAGFLTGDFVNRGVTYHELRSLLCRKVNMAAFFSKADAAIGSAVPKHEPDDGYALYAPSAEELLCAQCPRAHIRLMDEMYSSIRGATIRKVWKSGGERHVTGLNPAQFLGDCDERAHILLGWLEQSYPSRAVGIVCGNLHDGTCHVELIFWDGAAFKTFDPSEGQVYLFRKRFAYVYLIVM